MCTGVEIALLAATTVSAGTAIMSGMQAKETADMNAEMQRRQGEADKDAALAQAEKIRKAARAQVGEANAALAASGVSIGEGTPVRINEEIYKNSESDAYSTLLTGNRRARSAQEQAGIMQWQGQNAQTAGFLNAGSSILAAGSRVGGGWKTPTGMGGGSGLSAPKSGFWGS